MCQNNTLFQHNRFDHFFATPKELLALEKAPYSCSMHPRLGSMHFFGTLQFGKRRRKKVVVQISATAQEEETRASSRVLYCEK